MKKDIIAMGIETSCDETSVSIVKNGRKILSNTIFSQIKQHQRFGGVVPEIASRQHLEAMAHIAEQSLKEADISFKDVDLVAVTHGPGLIGALLVGVSYAKGVAYALNKPLVGVNHIEGHIFANFLENNFAPPFLCLVVSGGHSHLVYIKDYGDYEVMGRTIDDAAGEAFDKIARALGLGYPGGPAIEEAAKSGNETAISFPVAHIEENDLSFSFSGLKSAVLNYLNHQKQKGEPIVVEDVAASFQKAVVDALVENTLKAAQLKDVREIALAGGVASNHKLRNELTKRAGDNFRIHFPPPILCTDNAAMIACAGYYQYLRGAKHDLSLNAYANLSL